MGKKWNNRDRFYFLGLQNPCRWLITAMKLKDACSLEEVTANLDSILKNRDIILPTKICIISYIFSSSHVPMWELNHKEARGPKNWCYQSVLLEKTLESPLDCKKIQPVHPKGNQSCTFIGRTDAEAKAPIFWLPDAKSRLIGQDHDAGKDGRQKEKV